MQQKTSKHYIHTFMFFPVLLIFCPRLSLKRTFLILTRVTCSREMGFCFTLHKKKNKPFGYQPTCMHSLMMLQFSMSGEFSWTATDSTSISKDKKLAKDRWKRQFYLHQMFSYSLKWQRLLVFTTLMGFQLVPLVELLFTALMVALKENKQKPG